MKKLLVVVLFGIAALAPPLVLVKAQQEQAPSDVQQLQRQVLYLRAKLAKAESDKAEVEAARSACETVLVNNDAAKLDVDVLKTHNAEGGRVEWGDKPRIVLPAKTVGATGPTAPVKGAAAPGGGR